MMNFSGSWRPDPEEGEGGIMVVTAERLSLVVRPIETDHVDGNSLVALGAHFQDRLIARSAIPREDLDMVLRMMRVPAQLGLMVKEQADDGVAGSLVAILPPAEVRDIVYEKEIEDEPWKASLEAPAFEAEKAAEQPVMVPLGKVVRVPGKRVSPGSLQEEAADMLKTLVTKGGRDLVDDVLDDVI